MKNSPGFWQNNKWQTCGITLAGLGVLAVARAVYRRVTSIDFHDKVVLITGGSRGLGLEMARIVAGKGAKLVLCARSEQHLENAAEELRGTGAEVLTVSADLSLPESAPQVVQKVIDRFGRIDVLINNAGVMLVGPDNLMEIDDYRELMDANFWSALYMIKAALPHFRGQGSGHIANISSIGGKIAVPHMLPYSASKFALTGMSEGLAAELKKENIHVTTVVPSLMRTGSPRNISLKGDHEGEYAWFKLADSLPLLSQDARKAASQIVDGIAAGDTEVVLTPIARSASILNGIAPGALTTIMQWTDRFLPQSENASVKKGFESESETTTGIIGSRTDQAAARNNEL
ncbi:Short-chain dehydrogenase [Dyadobacter soli]|uniref:Short-chain dehydrogenase n=1 Tax=Dyadobacter soli TaxID=659014 RepID=A0A1G7D3F2_9BACT|nr:SDR family NAD(P)-dependent oxidoreductase [Dyadobacter soli]SDE45255.1 Short-chain dehydrogenase [Dyadobacter soli]